MRLSIRSCKKPVLSTRITVKKKQWETYFSTNLVTVLASANAATDQKSDILVSVNTNLKPKGNLIL